MHIYQTHNSGSSVPALGRKCSATDQLTLMEYGRAVNQDPPHSTSSD